jgi:2-iminobutanoate/2-iminopropanoate deaminase
MNLNIYIYNRSNGSSLKYVAKTNVFLSDMADFDKMNQIYSRYFTEPYPARSTVAVKTLPKNTKVEIELEAFSPNSPTPQNQ